MTPAIDLCVEDNLSQDLLACWKGWHTNLCADGRVLRRFLELLVSIRDGEGHAWGSVGVGPRALDACMIPAVILMLAVAVCGDRAIHPSGGGPLRPTDESPGNLFGHGLRAHGTGAQRVEGKDIESWLSSQTQSPWRSRIVILAGTSVDSPKIRSRMTRMNAPANDQHRLPADLSWPALLTLDDGFKRALVQGRQATTLYLQRIFRNLHALQKDAMSPVHLSPSLRGVTHG